MFLEGDPSANADWLKGYPPKTCEIKSLTNNCMVRGTRDERKVAMHARFAMVGISSMSKIISNKNTLLHV